MPEKNYLVELFKNRGLGTPPTAAEPLIGTGLVPVKDKELDVPSDSRFMSAVAALLYNVEPLKDEQGQHRFDKGEVMNAVSRIDQLIEAQMNEILHHEKFQQVEASWRGLEDLIQQTNFQANI